MENSIYIGLSKQMVLRNNLNIIANNVANMNTTGYRGQNTLFEEYISDPRGNEDAMSFVYDRGQYQNTTPGPLQQTGNPLDIALNGPGFFAIEGPGNTPTYTRGGDFQLDANGVIVTADGYPVKGGNGQITVPPGVGSVTIDKKGVVSTPDGEIGQLNIVEFENLQQLKPMGGNLYTTDEQARPAEETTVHQGALEGSNVNAVLEMTRMIDNLRAFQELNQLMTKENDRLRGAIQKLTGGN